MPLESDAWPLERIGRIARLVELEDVTLVHCEAIGMNPETFEPAHYDSRWSTVPIGPEGPIEPKRTGVAQFDVSLDILVVFEYSSERQRPEDREPTQDFGVKAVFLLKYKLNQDEGGAPPSLDVEDVRAFADFNATYNAWPYWREFVQSMAVRMGLPPVIVRILPVPNLGRARDA